MNATASCLTTHVDSARVKGIATIVEVGGERDITVVRFMVVNFPDVMLPRVLSRAREGGLGCWRGRVQFHGGPWTVTLDARPDLRDTLKRLKAAGGFAFTHCGTLTASDDASFRVEEGRDALRGVSMLLRFARGAWAPATLPAGENASQEVVWQEWTDARCDPWYQPFSWLDKTKGESIASVGTALLAHWSDPFWQEVLRLGISHYLEANRSGGPSPPFVESRIVEAQAGLELLAHALIHERRGRQRVTKVDGKGGSAAARIRGMLKAAAVDCGVPPELQSLTAYARQQQDQAPSPDGPWAVTEIRNAIMHPKTGGRSPSILPGGVLSDVWKLSVWYLELLLLNILDFQGEHSCRLEEGGWVSATRPVPWTTATGP